MSTADHKSKDATAGAVMMLSPDKGASTGRNNYVEWIVATHDDLGQHYGVMASVLTTQVAYDVPSVVPADYTPEPEPNLPPFSAANIMQMRVNAHAARAKEVRKLAEIKPKFFNAIFARTSVASRLLMEADGDFAAANAALDPNELIAIIHRTHFTHVDGATAVEAMDNLETMFNNLRQGPTQNIAVFKKEFDTQARCLEIAGAPPLDPQRLALKFLKKLDQARHGPMFVHLMNGRSAGGAFPDTVDAAYAIAKDWKSSSTRVSDSRGIVANGAAFMLADDVRALVIVPPAAAAPRRLPVKGTTKENASSTGRERVRFASPPISRTAAPSGAVRREKRPEVRTCWECNTVGHVRRECPRRVLIAVGDEEDEDALYETAMNYGDAACMMTRCLLPEPRHRGILIDDGGDEPKHGRTRVEASDRVLFSPTEVIFDNAASRSLFENSELLRDIVQSNTPMVIGGVQKGAAGIRIDNEGTFRDLGKVGVGIGAAGNILSACQMVDTGRPYRYDNVKDEYVVSGNKNDYVFTRRRKADGSKSRFYTRDFALIATVKDNLRRYTAREVKQIDKAEQLMQRLGHMTSAATIGLINSGLQNCPVTASDVRNKDAAKGMSAAGLMGKTKKHKSVSPGYVLAPRVTQVQQVLSIDIIFVKKIAFLLGVLTPLGLGIVEFLRDRSTDSVETAVRTMLAKAASRSFDVLEIRCDGEGAVGALSAAMQLSGIRVSIAGPGQHVSVVERMAQTVKSRHRCHELALPFVMTHTLIVWCMKFCMNCVNLQPSATSTDNVSPFEQFSGLKLDAKRDLRVAFGDYVLATVAETDNSMLPRAEPCIALGGKLNPTGSVWMLSLKTYKIVTRDQFIIQPMPELVIAKITEVAARQGYSRGQDPTLEVPDVLEEELDDALLPDMMEIDGRAIEAEPIELMDAAGAETLPPPAGVSDLIRLPQSECPAGPRQLPPAPASPRQPPTAPDSSRQVPTALDSPPPGSRQLRSAFRQPPQASALGQVSPVHRGVRWSQRLSARTMSEVLLARRRPDVSNAIVKKHTLSQSEGKDVRGYAFKISVNAALREREEEARPVIMAELQQMVDKKVWHAVHTFDLTAVERKAVIRSSMFLKDKYMASGMFDKFKARLVAGGDQQDKELYDNLSSPTASTTSVLAIASIAAHESRSVIVMDIGGAFLNADITNTGIKVHMRLNRVLTAMLVLIDPEHAKFVEEHGTSVVELNKALYGCVEAAALWYANLCATLKRDGFIPNCYDPCIFNKFGADGAQITAAMHVDDLLVASTSNANLEKFEDYMRGVYSEIKVNKGRVLDYLGMTFDFVVPGQVSITMDNCEQDILAECGVWALRCTPAASTLFDTRDAPKATDEEVKFFRTYVAKMLYLAKRIKPECLVAVAFLTTRVNDVDVDDIAKLKRLLGYLRATQHRGIVLRIGDTMTVRAYIDASYGVHQSCGKSHTGCAIVLGDAGVLTARSSKQKIVTKSSTEAELVGLSDSAAQAIHLRNFVMEQGYKVGPAVIYQDNLSCMALMKRGGPGSERSRHISIRHFWVAERVSAGDVVIKHTSTDLMFANALTKPVQGAQFERERRGLTNWD